MPDTANLLVNGSGEANEAAGQENEPPIGWTCTAPPGHRWYTTGRTNRPIKGNRLLWPGHHEGKVTELTQTVNFSQYATDIDANKVEMNFSGWIGTWDKRNGDECQITAWYLDEGGVGVGLAFDTGRVFPRYDEDLKERWQKVDFIHIRVPPRTRACRVELIGHYLNGKDTDAYFDELSLVLRIFS